MVELLYSERQQVANGTKTQESQCLSGRWRETEVHSSDGTHGGHIELLPRARQLRREHLFAVCQQTVASVYVGESFGKATALSLLSTVKSFAFAFSVTYGSAVQQRTAVRAYLGVGRRRSGCASLPVPWSCVARFCSARFVAELFLGSCPRHAKRPLDLHLTIDLHPNHFLRSEGQEIICVHCVSYQPWTCFHAATLLGWRPRLEGQHCQAFFCAMPNSRGRLSARPHSIKFHLSHPFTSFKRGGNL
jgi:hypothetical protein